jgi:hypothetical protein
MKKIKRHIFTGILMVLVLSGAYAQTSVDRSQLVGTWQQVDSLGNPLMANKDFCEYKIITPETFSVVQVVKSKGYFISMFLGTYNLENDTYIENITYANPGAIKMVGTKNLFYFALKNNLMYVSGMNNPYKQIWKKIDKLPEAVVVQPQTDVPTLLKKSESANVEFAGGNGLTIDNAVIIKVKSETSGIAAEYDFIASKYGVRNVAWRVLSQSVQNKKNKVYDVISIKLAKNDEKLDVYFDITNFYGKF